MSKVGRNQPCPCGSGKKYKKCCIDKHLPEVVKSDAKQYFDSFLSYEEVNQMNTEEIINNLHNMGIPFEKEAFFRDVEKFYSAQELSEHWFDTYSVKALDRDEDFPWFAAWILWERLVPTNKMSMEQMSDLIDKGFEVLNVNDSKSACDNWLRIWDAIKYRIKPEFKTLKYLDKHYNRCFFIINFCQDLEGELHNAGLEDSEYFKKRIDYCREFCNFFPEEEELIIHNMRRAIIASYICLEKFDEAKKELDRLVTDYPDNAWSYIEYGDAYCYGNELIKDLVKAKEFYNKALLVAKGEYDKKAVEERLEDLQD